MIDENIPFALNILKLVRPNLKSNLNELYPCIPTIDFCKNSKPKGGKFKIYVEIQF